MDDPARQPSPRHLRLHGIQVFVSDADRSLVFYRDALNFKVVFDVRIPTGQRSIGVAPADGTSMFILMEASEDTTDLVGKTTGVVFVTNEIRAIHDEWSARGVTFLQAPETVRWESGARTAEFADPDGNRFRLIEVSALTERLESDRRAAEERLHLERRAAHEMDIARDVQRRLFPQSLPSLDTLDCASACVPARHVGGDYYDFLDLGERRVGIALGDVAGKGMAAALLMANLQAHVRSHTARATQDLPAMLESVNHLFVANGSGSSYATLFFGVYDDQSRRLKYVNCGHLPPLLLRADGRIATLDPTSAVLGFFEPLGCTSAEIAFGTGDTLLLYTDGVTEALSPEGEEFGDDRLIAELRRSCHESAARMIASIVDTVREFSGEEQEDDLTLLAVRAI